MVASPPPLEDVVLWDFNSGDEKGAFFDVVCSSFSPLNAVLQAEYGSLVDDPFVPAFQWLCLFVSLNG